MIATFQVHKETYGHWPAKNGNPCPCVADAFFTFHFHDLLGGTWVRNEITLAHQLEHHWFAMFGQKAIAKCRAYDRSEALADLGAGRNLELLANRLGQGEVEEWTPRSTLDRRKKWLPG